jgi:hypothetical protein
MGLRDTIHDPSVKSNIVTDCVKLIDEQVSSKKGISGLALKTAYNVVNGIGPSYVPKAIERLLPEALTAIEPMWNDGMQSGDPVEYLTQNRAIAANAILSVTDARIEKSSNGIVRAAYSKLRQSVKGDVESAVPGLAKIINAYVSA